MYDAHYIKEASQVRVYKRAADCLKSLKAAGFKLIVVTNQSGVGRGIVTSGSVKSVNKKLQDTIMADGGPRFDAIYICEHTPEAHCHCRKPKIHFAKLARRAFGLDLERSYFIGDKDCDLDFARRAGLRGILVRTGHGAKTFKMLVSHGHGGADHVATGIKGATEWILSQDCNP